MKSDILLPNLYGVFEVKYFSKNRIRMEIAKLKNNSSEIETLKNNLNKIEIVKKFRIIPSLGSISLDFDDKQVDSQFMLGIVLKLLALEDEILKKRSGKLKTSFNSLINFSDLFIYNKTKGLLDTKSLTALILLIYGAKKLKTSPTLPAGATLIWWAYNLFIK